MLEGLLLEYIVLILSSRFYSSLCIYSGDDATSTSPSMPRSRSDGSLWARFRDTCITMTHSATQDQLQENVPH